MLDLVIKALETEVEKSAVRYQSRIKRLEELFESVNNNVSPNIDSMGRFHAPMCGYIMPECVAHIGEPDKIYRKGEFIPTPFNPNDDDAFYALSLKSNSYHNKFGTFKTKVKITNELADGIINMDQDYINFSKGKVWNDGDADVCYLYVSSLDRTIASNFMEAITSVIERKSPTVIIDKGDAPVGKVLVKGTVVSVRDIHSYYGVVTKMLVVLENKSTVYGSVPKDLLGDDLNGIDVEFSATFESGDDKTHAFFKRPTKAKFI